MENWERCFAQPTGGASIFTHDVQLSFYGDIGVVCCRIEPVKNLGVFENMARPAYLDNEG